MTNVVWSPTDRQQVFLAAEEEEVLYGGAAGGGKTDAFIVDALGLWQSAPLVPRYKALILRRSYQQLREVIDRARALYPTIQGLEGVTWNEQKHEFRFPSGAKVIMGYAERDADVFQFQGEEFQWIGVEELTQYPSDVPPLTSAWDKPEAADAGELQSGRYRLEMGAAILVYP